MLLLNVFSMIRLIQPETVIKPSFIIGCPPSNLFGGRSPSSRMSAKLSTTTSRTPTTLLRKFSHWGKTQTNMIKIELGKLLRTLLNP